MEKDVDVKILNYLDHLTLERKIEEGIRKGYRLTGPVTVGVNMNANVIFVATMIKEKGSE